jgi:hypothetical protein
MRKIFVFQFLFVFMVICTFQVKAQVNTVSADNKWDSQQVTLKNTLEADYIIRIGDVDNLGFGWPEGFDPFCGRLTESHGFPWVAQAEDMPGFDRILLSSKFNPDGEFPCGTDGYMGSYNRNNPNTTKPVTWSLPTDVLRGVEIKKCLPANIHRRFSGT